MLGDGADVDVIALAEDPLEVAVQIFYVRGGRVRGQRGWVADRVTDAGTRRAGRGLPAPALRRHRSRPRGRGDPARDPGARDAARRRHVRVAVQRAARQPRCRSGCRSGATRRACRRRSAAQRRAVAGHAQAQAGQRPDQPQPGAGGDPGGARAGGGAAADRVLRRLQPAGHRGRRLDGGLRGRAGPQERVPPVRDQGRRRPERRGLDARGDHPAVPAAARRAGRSKSGGGAPTESGSDAGRSGDRPSPQVRLRAWPGGGRRRSAAGRRGQAGPRRARHRRHPGVRVGQAPGGGVAARASPTRSSWRARRRASTSCSGSATRPTASRSPTTAPAGPRRWSRACSTTCRAWGRCGARPCSSTSGR